MNILNFKLIKCYECENILQKNSDQKKDEVENCCYNISNHLIQNEICIDILSNITEITQEKRIEFNHFKDECNEISETLEKEKNWINLNNFNKCKDIDVISRNLQIKSGFGSHIRLPTMNSALTGPEETQTNNIFSFQNQKICESILALHFVKVCKKLCDKELSMTVKESIFPSSCFPSCVDFSKHACIEGCELFGCNVSFEDCSYQMCNFQLG